MSSADEPEDVLARGTKAFQDLYVQSLPPDLRDPVLLPDRELWDMDMVADAMRTAPFKSVYKLHAVASALNRNPGLIARVDDLVVALGMGRNERIRDGLEQFAGGVPPWDRSDPSTVPKLTPERWGEFLRALGLEDVDLDTDLETVE